MRTSMGKGCADVFNRTSLEEIKSWADNAAIMLKGESQRLHQTGAKLAEVKEYMSDQMDFETLSSAIKAILAE